MENLTKEQIEKINEFLSGLDTEIDVKNYVDIYEIDFESAYDSIFNQINDKDGFDFEYIGYWDAMQYLLENDTSLKTSLGIASELCYEPSNLSSEVLASLLATRLEAERFEELENEINTFFSELLEEINETQNG